MSARIVVFGATGHTGGLVARRLAASGTRPVLAGRSAERLAALAADLDGLEWVRADAQDPDSVLAAVRDGDVLVATVGPFARWGDPAVRAAIAAGATYLDSTGEPAFIRHVFADLDAPARRAGAALLTAMGFDWVPGALAGSLAVREAGPAAVRVDVGCFGLGIGLRGLSAGTRRSMVGAALDGSHAFRDGAMRGARPAERVRTFHVAGAERAAVSVGGAEHFTLPAAHPQLREVNVYVGGLGPLARPVQVASAAGGRLLRLPGLRHGLRAAGERLAGLPPGRGPSGAPGRCAVAAITADAAGAPLAEVRLAGGDPYAFTGGLLAWAARRAASEGVRGAGALGPVQAFGLDALVAGCAEAGLVREPA